MDAFEPRTPTRQAAISGLAVVGFIALVALGMWLAVYSTRYVPAVVGTVGSAAVYLGSVFTPGPEPTLSVIPTPILASSTISRSEANSIAATDTKPTVPAPAKVKPTATTPGEKTTSTYPISGAPSTTALSGLPDFIVTINSVGYLTTVSTDSFVASSTAPAGSRPAVSFTIKNVGTNTTGPWCFSATIPTQSSYLYQSQSQQPLNPGDSIDYTLGFDQAYRGADQMISITANIANTSNTATCSRTVTEFNANNNSASAKLTIIGG